MTNAVPAEPLRLESRLYRPREVAKLLGIPLPSVYIWLKSGEIRSTKIGSRFFIPPSEVERIFSVPNEPEPAPEPAPPAPASFTVHVPWNPPLPRSPLPTTTAGWIAYSEMQEQIRAAEARGEAADRRERRAAKAKAAWTTYSATSRAEAKRIARDCAGVEPSLLAPSESSVVSGYEEPERGSVWAEENVLDRFDDLEVDVAFERVTLRFDRAVRPFSAMEMSP